MHKEKIVKTKNHAVGRGFFGGATRNRTGDEGFADLCLTAWLWRRVREISQNMRHKREQEINDNNLHPLNYLLSLDISCRLFPNSGADYGARTRHLDLGKVALYQMS